MKCATKEELQRNCTGAWDAYISAVSESQATSTTANFLPSHLKRLAALGYQAGKTSGAFLDAVRLLGEHSKASRALSKHLSEHRC